MNNPTKIFLQKTTVLEKKYITLLRKAIKRFRSSFITNLTAYGKDTAVSRLHLTPLSDELTPILLSIYKNAGLFGARFTAAQLKQLAGQKANGFGQNEKWIEEVLQFLRLHLLKFVTNITDTMRQDILNVLEKGITEGWSITEIVSELRKTDLPLARARVIARTEIIRAANVGHSVAAKDTSFEVLKKWSAARDHRTRHSHRGMHNITIDEDGTFKVPIYKKNIIIGYDNMLYPGDATASAANTINCRCRITHVPKRDANGKLIYRTNTPARVIPIRTPTRIDVPLQQIAAALKANIRIAVKMDDE